MTAPGYGEAVDESGELLPGDHDGIGRFYAPFEMTFVHALEQEPVSCAIVVKDLEPTATVIGENEQRVFVRIHVEQ